MRKINYQKDNNIEVKETLNSIFYNNEDDLDYIVKKIFSILKDNNVS